MWESVITSWLGAKAVLPDEAFFLAPSVNFSSRDWGLSRQSIVSLAVYANPCRVCHSAHPHVTLQTKTAVPLPNFLITNQRGGYTTITRFGSIPSPIQSLTSKATRLLAFFGSALVVLPVDNEIRHADQRGHKQR